MSKYGQKEYEEDVKAFEPESVGEGEPLSDKAFKAQERMNKNPEVGKAYYKSRHQEHR